MQLMRCLSVSLLLGMAAHAQDTVVIALVEFAQPADYALMPEPECASRVTFDEIPACTATWTRYALTKVVRLDGVVLDATTALIYTDQQIDGPKLLQLETLTEPDAQRYGAPYKAVSVTTLFSGACVDKELPIQANDKVLGPTQIDLTPQAKCYLLPAWWAR